MAYMMYDLMIDQIKKNLENNEIEKAEKSLYFAIFHYAEDKSEDVNNIDVGNSIFNLFFYIKQVNFTDKIPTACVDLMNNKMLIGSKFFQEQVKSMDDMLFIIFHERNHSIIDYISKLSKTYLRDTDIDFMTVNFAEDAYVNGHVMNFIHSDIPERYYNNPENLNGEKKQFALLSSNTYGFYNYIKDITKNKNLDKDMINFFAKNSNAKAVSITCKTMEENAYLLFMMHNMFYKKLDGKNLVRNNVTNKDEQNFYNEINKTNIRFEYADWMNIFFRWYKSLDKEQQENFDGSNDVVTINIDLDALESFNGSSGDGEGQEKQEKDSGDSKDNKDGDKEKNKGKGYSLDKETKDKVNNDAKIKIKMQKEKGGKGCSHRGYDACENEFPKPETAEEKKMKDILKKIKNSNIKDEFQDMISDSMMQLQNMSFEVVANNVAKNIISSNCINHDISGSSFLMPSVLNRKDLFTLGTGNIPTYYNRSIDIGSVNYQIYVDVSGSMDSYLPIVGFIVKKLKEYVNKCYMFSTEVFEQPLNKLDYYKTTGGTDFDIVAESIIKNKYKNVIIISDGECSMSEENQKALKKQLSNLYYIKTGSKGEDVFTKITKHKVEEISLR